ncbi:molybdopterin-binding protein [Methylobacterium sp. J-068]|nr:molybdopterin-binding protein [Methylobacterium sp. J-068]MCJ2037325.1 molybdopterin-binding protein [Methylobacterium sp. J-068]
MPLAEAVARLTGSLAPLEARDVPLAGACGLIAGADIVSPRDDPATARALSDGWAARAEDVFGASPYAPIPLSQPLAWVEAGAILPEGCDCVLPPEAIEGRSVVADAPVWSGTRAAGEEIAAGRRLIAAGARLTPLRLMALAAAGIASVPVRRPRLLLVVTGSTEPDTLSPVVAGLAGQAGAVVTRIVRAAAAPDAIAAAIRASDADATLILGGTGFGRHDHSAAGLASAGTVHAHGIALKPGETAAFGAADGRPVLLLPGRPDAALSAFLALGHPLIDGLSGATAPVSRVEPLSRKVTSTIGLSEIVFTRREAGGVTPLGGADLPLQSLMEADGAILLAPDSEGYPAGTRVEVLPL